MTEAIDRLEAVIGADISGLQSGLKAAKGLLGGFAATAAAGFVVKSASDFDKNLRNIQATARLSNAQMAVMNKELLDLGRNSVAGPQAVSEAMYDVVGGVQDSKKWMDILKQSVATSEAGQADLAATTRGLVFITNAYNMSAKEMTNVSDVLTRTVGVGVGTMDEFVGAMSPIAVTAKTVGVSFKDLGKMTAFLTTKGNSASESATQLQSIMQALLKPNTAMEKQLKKLGFASGSAALKQLGFIGTLNALKKSAGGSSDALAKMFGRVEGFKGVLSLTGGDFGKFSKDFESGLNGATAAARNIQLQGFDAQFKLLQSSFHTLAIEVGQVLLPPLIKFVQIITEIVRAASGGFSAVKNFMTALFAPGDVGARISAVLSQAIPMVQKAAGDLLGKIGEFISDNFPKVLKGFEDILGKVGDWLSAGGLTKLLSGMVDLFRGVVDWFTTTGWPLFKMGVESLWTQLITFLNTDGVQRFWGGIQKVVGDAANWLMSEEGAGKFIAGIAGAFGRIVNWILTDGIPQFEKAFEDLINAIGKFIEEKLPGVLTTAIQKGIHRALGAGGGIMGIVEDTLAGKKPPVATGGGPIVRSNPFGVSGTVNDMINGVIDKALGNRGNAAQTKRGRAFASGGWTGERRGVAGAVHGREFVVPEQGALVMRSGGGGYSGPSIVRVQLYTDRLIEEIDVNLAAAMAGG